MSATASSSSSSRLDTYLANVTARATYMPTMGVDLKAETIKWYCVLKSEPLRQVGFRQITESDFRSATGWNSFRAHLRRTSRMTQTFFRGLNYKHALDKTCWVVVDNVAFTIFNPAILLGALWTSSMYVAEDKLHTFERQELKGKSSPTPAERSRLTVIEKEAGVFAKNHRGMTTAISSLLTGLVRPTHPSGVLTVDDTTSQGRMRTVIDRDLDRYEEDIARLARRYMAETKGEEKKDLFDMASEKLKEYIRYAALLMFATGTSRVVLDRFKTGESFGDVSQKVWESVANRVNAMVAQNAKATGRMYELKLELVFDLDEGSYLNKYLLRAYSDEEDESIFERFNKPRFDARATISYQGGGPLTSLANVFRVKKPYLFHHSFKLQPAVLSSGQADHTPRLRSSIATLTNELRAPPLSLPPAEAAKQARELANYSQFRYGYHGSFLANVDESNFVKFGMNMSDVSYQDGVYTCGDQAIDLALYTGSFATALGNGFYFTSCFQEAMGYACGGHHSSNSEQFPFIMIFEIEFLIRDDDNLTVQQYHPLNRDADIYWDGHRPLQFVLSNRGPKFRTDELENDEAEINAASHRASNATSLAAQMSELSALVARYGVDLATVRERDFVAEATTKLLTKASIRAAQVFLRKYTRMKALILRRSPELMIRFRGNALDLGHVSICAGMPYLEVSNDPSELNALRVGPEHYSIGDNVIRVTPSNGVREAGEVFDYRVRFKLSYANHENKYSEWVSASNAPPDQRRSTTQYLYAVRFSGGRTDINVDPTTLIPAEFKKLTKGRRERYVVTRYLPKMLHSATPGGQEAFLLRKGATGSDAAGSLDQITLEVVCSRLYDLFGVKCATHKIAFDKHGLIDPDGDRVFCASRLMSSTRPFDAKLMDRADEFLSGFLVDVIVSNWGVFRDEDSVTVVDLDAHSKSELRAMMLEKDSIENQLGVLGSLASSSSASSHGEKLRKKLAKLVENIRRIQESETSHPVHNGAHTTKGTMKHFDLVRQRLSGCLNIDQNGKFKWNPQEWGHTENSIDGEIKRYLASEFERCRPRADYTPGATTTCFAQPTVDACPTANCVWKQTKNKAYSVFRHLKMKHIFAGVKLIESVLGPDGAIYVAAPSTTTNPPVNLDIKACVGPYFNATIPPPASTRLLSDTARQFPGYGLALSDQVSKRAFSTLRWAKALLARHGVTEATLSDPNHGGLLVAKILSLPPSLPSPVSSPSAGGAGSSGAGATRPDSKFPLLEPAPAEYVRGHGSVRLYYLAPCAGGDRLLFNSQGTSAAMLKNTTNNRAQLYEHFFLDMKRYNGSDKRRRAEQRVENVLKLYDCSVVENTLRRTSLSAEAFNDMVLHRVPLSFQSKREFDAFAEDATQAIASGLDILCSGPLSSLNIRHSVAEWRKRFLIVITGTGTSLFSENPLKTDAYFDKEGPGSSDTDISIYLTDLEDIEKITTFAANPLNTPPAATPDQMYSMLATETGLNLTALQRMWGPHKHMFNFNSLKSASRTGREMGFVLQKFPRSKVRNTKYDAEIVIKNGINMSEIELV